MKSKRIQKMKSGMNYINFTIEERKYSTDGSRVKLWQHKKRKSEIDKLI